MSEEVITTIRLPRQLFQSLKVKAAHEHKSMKQLIIEGLSYVLGKSPKVSAKTSATSLLLKYSGQIKTATSDGARNHDHYIYDK